MNHIPSRRTFLAAALALLITGLFAEAKTGWSENYEKALADAKASGKLVLLDFTGSDWCSWCIKMDKEVFDQKTFKDYAKDNLILVEVDFPNGKKLPAHIAKQNDSLKEKYKVEGFPTLVVLDGSGKTVKEFGGYQEGGAEKFVESLKALKH